MVEEDDAGRAMPYHMIGLEVHRSAWRTIDQADLDGFAAATLAWHWIHNDPERCRRESPYGAPIAQGNYLLALYPSLRALLDEELPPYAGVRTAIHYGINRVRFPEAVRVGERLRSKTTLLEVRAAEAGFMATEEYVVQVEGRAKPGCVAEFVVLFLLDPGGQRASG